VTFTGRYETVSDAVLMPPPARRPPLMIGATRTRTLEIAIAHVDAWNTWYDWYGNTPSGFAIANRRVDELVTRAGREPTEVLRSACVLIVLDRSTGERPLTDAAPPVEGSPDDIAAFLSDLAAAGADEAILVVSPITETSIRFLGRALSVLDERL
jgi:alkanesulfonate monooxygenase SsuD/methylene tetrahydromethanopterin reductase-like flavin-dependent oxidoreductase (luciferase family)